MIETRRRTITVYAVGDKEFFTHLEAREAALRQALSSHLVGAQNTIAIVGLARALDEPAIRQSLKDIIDSPRDPV